MATRIKRKKGAQKGNQNARKHGFYARVLDEADKLDFQLAAGVDGIDDESTNYNAADTKMAAALGFMHLFNPYIGLGAHVGFTYLGLGGDLALDVDPMLRFQVPITIKGRRFWISAWRRSRWKYCAGVVQLATRMLPSAPSWRKRSTRPLECSGPDPS